MTEEHGPTRFEQDRYRNHHEHRKSGDRKQNARGKIERTFDSA
jgi:hypothetical protein